MKFIYYEVEDYLCEDCETELHTQSGWPYAQDDDGNYYCLDCGLKRGLISPMYWLVSHGIGIYHHATYKDGVITGFQKWGRGYRKDEIKV